jgi:hypothetical protein
VVEKTYVEQEKDGETNKQTLRQSSQDKTKTLLLLLLLMVMMMMMMSCCNNLVNFCLNGTLNVAVKI